MIILKRILVLIFAFFIYIASAEAEVFTVEKIQVDGLQRISLGTFLNYLPVKEGDRIDSEQTSDIIRALYKTGFFSDVSVARSGSTLLISVVERSVIGEINISGNDKISKKQLLGALKEIGLTEGQILDNSVLSGLEQALVQQYYNLGFYNVQIKTTISKSSQNKVAVNIAINEGVAAKITKISIIGNNDFDEKTLLKKFSLSTPIWWKPWSDSDQYSREKLDADLEKLHSFYLDRGYLRFNIDSTQVSITPDKKHIYIVIHITEGGVYRVSGSSITGNLLGRGDALKRLVIFKPGDIFSRQDIIDTTGLFTRLYGDMGYALPTIKSEPVIDDKNHTVFVKFYVDPGKRVYVRRINFAGNIKTDEYVLRREMRQQEGALYSLSKVNESRRRLANLGYLTQADVKIEPVAGQPDEIDLNYTVKETSSAEAKVQAGYSSNDGFIYGASINEQNFMGTGKNVSAQFDNSDSTQAYSVSYLNPYHTINGVSLKLTASAQVTNASDEDISSYSADVYGGSVVYGIPLSDYSRTNLGYGYELTDLKTDSDSPDEITDFTEKYGKQFNEVKLIMGWLYNKLDRAIFSTQGFAQYLNGEVDLPPTSDDLAFYRITHNTTWYKPLYKDFVLHTRTELGYGSGFGDGTLPFFKNFFLGGMNSVRGFDGNSIGPRDSNGDPMGGNVVESGSVGLILPPFFGDSIRTTVFVDTGNVYDNQFSLSDFRASTGIEFEWRSPIGPLAFSFAEPISSHSGDDKRFFDFSVGTSF